MGYYNKLNIDLDISSFEYILKKGIKFKIFYRVNEVVSILCIDLRSDCIMGQCSKRCSIVRDWLHEHLMDCIYLVLNVFNLILDTIELKINDL